MRIQLAATILSRTGGGHVYNQALALGLAERGHEVCVICQNASEQAKAGCQIELIDVPSFNDLPGLWRLSPYFQWRHLRRSIASRDLPPADAIISTTELCTAALWKKFPQAACVYMPHSRIAPVEVGHMLTAATSPIVRQVACAISKRCERWSLLNSKTTVRFSADNVTDLRRHYRLPDRVRFNVIPAGIVGPDAIEPRPPGTPLRLLVVGRLMETKNLRLLLESLARLAELPWALDILGDGPERAALESLAAERGLLPRVRFHGQQDDIGQFYSQADLHLFPSRLESLGLVVLEAMAYGVPTLGIIADGVRYRNANHEIIMPGVDGLLANDEPDFTRLLRSCLQGRQPLEELGRAARATYLERHQWPVVLDRWEELLHKIRR